MGVLCVLVSAALKHERPAAEARHLGVVQALTAFSTKQPKVGARVGLCTQ